MKKILLISLVLALVVSGVAIAKRVVTDAGAAIAGLGSHAAAIPADGNSYPAINALSFTAALATNDVTVYEGDNGVTTLSSIGYASSTVAHLTAYAAFDDGDICVVQNTAGTLWEPVVISDVSVGTCTALVNTYPAGSPVYEMKSLASWLNVGTTAITLDNTSGIFGGAYGKPLIFSISGGTISYITGIYQ